MPDANDHCRDSTTFTFHIFTCLRRCRVSHATAQRFGDSAAGVTPAKRITKQHQRRVAMWQLNLFVALTSARTPTTETATATICTASNNCNILVPVTECMLMKSAAAMRLLCVCRLIWGTSSVRAVYQRVHKMRILCANTVAASARFEDRVFEEGVRVSCVCGILLDDHTKLRLYLLTAC